jgi:RUN domain.
VIPNLYLKNTEFLELCSFSVQTVQLIFQNLLGVIGNILATHMRYKRSYDSHFKAFICAALKYVTFHNIAIYVVHKF